MAAADSALNFRGEKERFFLFVHYFDPHSPYSPPDSFLSPIFASDPKAAGAREMRERNAHGWMGERLLNGAGACGG